MKTYIVSEEVLRQVLDALESLIGMGDAEPAAEALRAILAKEPNEPVAWMAASGSTKTAEDVSYTPNWTDYYSTPLYKKDA